MKTNHQEIVISGVGGQGVLFMTRLLAEAAIDKGLNVFTSETHGMAQRGGTVLSHLKVGDFKSPLIRPGNADGLLVLASENIVQHGGYAKENGFAVINASADVEGVSLTKHIVDANKVAAEIGIPKAVNVVLLGYALGVLSSSGLFCTKDDIMKVMDDRLSGNQKLMASSKKAFMAGFELS